MSLQKLVKKHNISEEIKDINESLLKECFEQRELFDPQKIPLNNNFELNSKYTNFLYNIFYQISNKHLNKLLNVNNVNTVVNNLMPGGSRKSNRKSNRKSKKSLKKK